MNDKENSDLKMWLKTLSKNELVRVALKAMQLSEVYAEAIDVLKAENESLKARGVKK